MWPWIISSGLAVVALELTRLPARAAKRIARWSAVRMPGEEAGRFEEEWLAGLADRSLALAQLAIALSIAWSCVPLARELRASASLARTADSEVVQRGVWIHRDELASALARPSAAVSPEVWDRVLVALDGETREFRGQRYIFYVHPERAQP